MSQDDFAKRTDRTCLAVRHVAFEGLGAFDAPIRAQGYAVRTMDAAVCDPTSIDPLAPDLLVLLGGPVGVYETDAYPFIAHEIEWARARIDANRPILGLCLGAQVMTVALGGAVAPGAREIGIAPIELTEIGTASALRHLGDRPVLHWHGDAMALPAGADHLARTAATEVQAWSKGANVLALQFHAEADPAGIEHWLVGHANEIAAAGLDPRTIRADVADHGTRIAAAGRAMMTEWLERLEL